MTMYYWVLDFFDIVIIEGDSEDFLNIFDVDDGYEIFHFFVDFYYYIFGYNVSTVVIERNFEDLLDTLFTDFAQ